MSETGRNHPLTLLLTFLAGAAAGAAIAILTAPRSGRETRDRLKGLARDAARRAGSAPHLNEAYTRASRAARRAFNEFLDAEAPGGAGPTGPDGH
jgi:gas vesicle protein